MRRDRAPACEGDLTALVLVELSKRECLVWRNNTGQFWACKREGSRLVPVRPVQCGTTGSPDVVGFCRRCGAFVGFELKFGRNVPSPEQERFFVEMQRAGAICAIAYDLETVLAAWGSHHCGNAQALLRQATPISTG